MKTMSQLTVILSFALLLTAREAHAVDINCPEVTTQSPGHDILDENCDAANIVYLMTGITSKIMQLSKGQALDLNADQCEVFNNCPAANTRVKQLLSTVEGRSSYRHEPIVAPMMA